MKRTPALLLVLAVAMAAVAGTYAALRSSQLRANAAPKVSAAQINRQLIALDRAEAALRAQLQRKPPALPALPKATPQSVGSQPAAPVLAGAAAPRVTYVRPKPIIHIVHRHGGESRRPRRRRPHARWPPPATGATSMTNQIARLWTVVVGVLVFFLAWAAIAAHPWQQKAATDPRLTALALRQQVLQRQSLEVKHVLDRRWAAYRVALAQRKVAISRANVAAAAAATQAQAQAQAVSAPVATAAPAARIVTLPPLVITKTS